MQFVIKEYDFVIYKADIAKYLVVRQSKLIRQII